jgi:hypothetical protein
VLDNNPFAIFDNKTGNSPFLYSLSLSNMKFSVYISFLVVVVSSSSYLATRCVVDAFVPIGLESTRKAGLTKSASTSSETNENDESSRSTTTNGDSSSSRRSFMSQTIGTAASSAAFAAIGGFGTVLAPSFPANAVRGPDKVNARLKA